MLKYKKWIKLKIIYKIMCDGAWAYMYVEFEYVLHEHSKDM